MGTTAAAARNPALVSGLQEFGYTRPGASKRSVRETTAYLLGARETFDAQIADRETPI